MSISYIGKIGAAIIIAEIVNFKNFFTQEVILLHGLELF